MKGVDTIARVRREYFVRGRPIREIARELHISRNTVRRILRSGEIAFEYQRSVQPQPKLGPWREELDRLLAVNAARDRRERVTLLRIFEDLRGLGYEGGYDAVRRYASEWRRRQSAAAAAAFVPLSFDPGGECQVFCVWVIGSMLPERSKDDDDFQRTAGRAAEGLQAA